MSNILNIMTKVHTIGGFKIWISIEQLIDINGNNLGFIAFWSRSEPNQLVLGESVKKEKRILYFKSAKDAETHTLNKLAKKKVF